MINPFRQLSRKWGAFREGVHLGIEDARPTVTLLPPEPASKVPQFGIALGGGGARGLAHVKILQVLDEFHITPKIITGTSMGALIGSLYAAGMSGNELESYARTIFHNRTELLKRLYGNRPSTWASLFSFSSPAIFKAETFFEMFMPEILPETFEELTIPFQCVAVDFYTQQQVILSSGPIMPAIAASSSLPALLQPVKIGEHVLIDGGFVNPVPYNIFEDKSLFTIAVDVTGEPPRLGGEIPGSVDALIGASQIMLRSLTNTMIELDPSDCLIQPRVGRYNVLDYFKIDNILSNSNEAAEILRRRLDEFLTITIQRGE